MKPKIKYIFLVYLVNIAKGSIFQVKKDAPSDGRYWVRPNDETVDPPKVSLVKRIVPHNYKTPPIEYDSKFDTIFVPKFRIEKRINLNTKKAELASNEIFLQPFKAFPEKAEKPYYPVNINTLLKRIQNAENEKPQIKPEKKKKANLTGLFMSLKTYANKKNLKPLKHIDGSLKVFQDRGYEKPWDRNSQLETNSEESLLLQPSKRIRQKKQREYYKNLDTLLEALQSSDSDEYLQRSPLPEKRPLPGLLWKNVENNSNKKMQKMQASKIIDDILQDVQSVKSEKTKQWRHHTENIGVNSAEPSLQPIKVYLPREKQKDATHLDNVLQTLQSLNSEELQQTGQRLLTQNPENNTNNEDNAQVSKMINTLLNDLRDTKNKELRNKIKPELKKLLFKSFKSFGLNKNDFLSKLQTGAMLRQLQNTKNKPSPSELTSEENSDEAFWEPMKLPTNNLEASNDLNVATSDELWQPLKVPKQKQNIVTSVSLKTLLKQLRDLDDRKSRHKNHRLEEMIQANSIETLRPIAVPKQRQPANLEVFLKMLNMRNNQDTNSDVDSEEIPWRIRVNKQNLEAIEPELEGTDEELQQKEDTFLLYPKKNKKVQLAVRNLADLLKVWRYILSKKYIIQPLRDRGLNNVELDVEKHKPEYPFNFPHYSIWNFWTYDKTLLQDGCPGEQVKVGNKCIWTPPHRK